MPYTMDKNLEDGLRLLEEGKKVDTALKLINKSARKGTTKGKSFFEIGRIIREGINGNLEANPEEARKYYDKALSLFATTDDGKLDCLDYREMGDYFNYALGTEEADKNRAMEYYKKALDMGDEVSKERIAQLEKEMATGTANTAPVLTPAVEEKKDEAAPAQVEEKKEVAPAPAPAPAPVEEKKEVVAPTPAPAEEKEPVKASEVEPEGKTYMSDSKKVQSVIEGEQILIRAIRLIDSPISTDKEIGDGIELLKTAIEQGSMRAAVLLAYLYEGKSSYLAPNFELAKKYYEIACGRGSSVAEYRLGLLYLSPDTYFFNEGLGHEHIIKSARMGYAPALNYIGDSYRSKVTNPKNLEIAYRYYSLAGERGYGLSYHNMSEIDASRQEIDLAREHEKYAILNGYDPDTEVQDPLHNALHL